MCVYNILVKMEWIKKQRITKLRYHKTATTTKQRLLQNSDSYKTATVTNRRNHKTMKNNML